MKTLGICTTEEELSAMVNEVDENGNGEIDFDEFVEVMTRRVTSDYTAEEVNMSFKVFAQDAPQGFIKFDDLKKALMIYGSDKLSSADADALLSQLELTPDGQLFDYAGYVETMMK